MYRAAAVFFLQRTPVSAPLSARVEAFDWQALEPLRFDFSVEGSSLRCFLADEPLSADTLYSQETSDVVAAISQEPSLRAHIKKIQRRLAAQRRVVVEGRDVGTEVFPEAFFKVFMTASLAVRAERRYKDFLKNGETVSKQDILHALSQRDHMDETRTIGRLRRPKDSLLLDTSQMTAQQAAMEIVTQIRKLDVA